MVPHISHGCNILVAGLFRPIQDGAITALIFPEHITHALIGTHPRSCKSRDRGRGANLLFRRDTGMGTASARTRKWG
jgi:hypothetical protein